LLKEWARIEAGYEGPILKYLFFRWYFREFRKAAAFGVLLA
jgi:hypothetical protein